MRSKSTLWQRYSSQLQELGASSAQYGHMHDAPVVEYLNIDITSCENVSLATWD